MPRIHYYDEDTSPRNCLRCGRFLKKTELIDGICEDCYVKWLVDLDV